MKRISAICFAVVLLVSAVAGQINPDKQKSGGPDTLDSRLEDLVWQISDGLTENQKRRIAVVEFVDLKGNTSDFGRYLAEELITRLFQTGKIKVIERQLLNKVVAEQKLSLTGVIEPSSAQKLGKLLGVDAICAGSVSDLGKTLKINARLIDTETGEVFSVAAVEVNKDAAVCSLGGCAGIPEGPIDNRGNNNAATPGGRSMKGESNFFSFEIKQCSLSGTTAFCELLVTNKIEDRNLTLYGTYIREMLFGTTKGTRAFDQNNNSYSAKGAEIANSGKSNLASATLIKDMPAKARIYFEGVDPSAAKFTVLEIWFESKGVRATSIKIRDVPISQK